MRKHTGFLVSTSLSTYGKNMMQCEQNLWTKFTCTSSSWKGSLFSEGSMVARTSAQFAISPWQRESRVIILFSALYLVCWAWKNAALLLRVQSLPACAGAFSSWCRTCTLRTVKQPGGSWTECIRWLCVINYVQVPWSVRESQVVPANLV